MSDESGLTTVEKSPSAWWLVAGVVGVTTIRGAFWYFLIDHPERGTFGDMFGAVNVLFTGLAFAILAYTVWLQRKELEYQRQELRETRLELKGQKAQLQAQNDTLSRQRFENTFFQLLRVHQDIVNAMDVSGPHGGIPLRGRDCFNVIYDELKRLALREWPQNQPPDPGRIQATYLSVYEQRQQDSRALFSHSL